MLVGKGMIVVESWLRNCLGYLLLASLLLEQYGHIRMLRINMVVRSDF